MSTTLPSIQGDCDPRFAAVREAFAANFAAGLEVGAAVAVTVDGAPVVDLWAGHADADRTRPWQRETLVNVYSTTKGLGAACAHLLVQRGGLDLDAPVARYWPEYAQNGKAATPVRWLLSHRSAVPAVAEKLPPDAKYDWDRMTAALAAQAPWWEPGTAHGYHAFTYSFTVGEIVRRAAGKSIGTFLRDEITGPLGLETYIGLPETLDGRVADFLPPPPAAPGKVDHLATLLADHASMPYKAFNNPPFLRNEVNSRPWRAAEFAAANGHTTARSLAAFYGMLANGGTWNGVRVLAPETMEAARVEQSAGMDRVLQQENRFALGFMLPSPMRGISDNPRAFGHAGMGGSLGFADPEARMSFAYVMNQSQVGDPGGDVRWRGLISGVYAALGLPYTPPGAPLA